MRRLLALVTAVLLSAGLVHVSPSVALAPPTTLSWKACANAELAYYGLQCATLAVPLDRADPTGTQIHLALTRKRHTGAYQGVLLTNPGGPGGSGLSLPSLSDYVPGGAGAGYDWIGFDPRGVGASTPALRCSTAYFGYDRRSYVPRTGADTSYWLAKNRSYADACADTAAKRALLPHLATLDTVLDMESIRVALGAEKISYYGFSYGTYLGQVYATRYPSRVQRFILDGVVDPSRVWYAANLDQDRAFESAMNAFWRYVAAHHRSFRLGKHWQQVKRGYVRTLRRLDRHASAGGRLGPSELSDVMLEAGYYVYDWDLIAREYADLVRRNRGGALLGRYRDSVVGDDNEFAVYNAVQCTDSVWPTWARTRADAITLNKRAPFLTWGNTWYNAPCLTWHAPSRARLSVSGAAVPAKMLLISETGDAATPYAGALAVRRLFPSASLIAGVGGTTHASSLSGVACVDNAVASYLRNGQVPTRLSGTRADRSCPRVPPPSATGSGARSSVPGDRMSPMVRQDLIRAQLSGR